jgi:AcrR family transcriptional regulator
MVRVHRVARRSGKEKPGNPQISRAHWVRAGLALLAREGIDAVRVEPLAALLGVTKGSFYWHFANRGALHEAMLEAWRNRQATSIAAEPHVNAGHTLAALAAPGRQAARLESAIRAWARRDGKVARALAAIDRQRLASVARLLAANGAAPDAARTRAKLLTLAFIGSCCAGPSPALALSPAAWRDFAAIVLR